MAGVSKCATSGLAGCGFGSCSSIFRGNSATGCGGGSFTCGVLRGGGNIKSVVTYLGGTGTVCNLVSVNQSNKAPILTFRATLLTNELSRRVGSGNNPRLSGIST